MIWKIFLIGLFGGLLILICNTVVSKIIQNCFHYKIQLESNSPQKKTTKYKINITNKKLIPLYLIFIVLEEYIFRFQMLKFLNHYCDNLLLSVVISSILFTLVHTQYKYKLIQIFIMGLILCGTYIMSDSIICPIISHSVNNFTIIYLLKNNEKES